MFMRWGLIESEKPNYKERGLDMVRVANDDEVRECARLGAAILGAQRVEFLLYGVVSHLAEVRRNESKRFKSLDPEKFLRGDLDDLKATLGQLVREFGDKLLLTTVDLENFVNDRNLIAHNYWRLTKANLRGAQRLQDPEGFLTEFAERCSYWERVLRGLVAVMKRENARKLGEDANLSEEEHTYVSHYERHVATFLGEQERLKREC